MTVIETLWVGEDDIAAELGLDRDAMRGLRRAHLQEGVNWRRHQRRVELSMDAVALIRSAVVGEKEPASPEAPAAPEKEPAPDLLTVLRIPRNQRIVEAKKKDGRVVRVRVRDNKNFVAGMEIRARHIPADFEDMMTLEGRCPRWRGRW